MKRPWTAAIAICGMLLFCGVLHGATLYQVNLDTADLIGHPAGPFYLELAFVDGEGFGDGNNAATFSNFSFGGGTPLGSPVVFGDVTGSIDTTLRLGDASFLSLFSQQFLPGLELSFRLAVTSNDDAGGIPDGLTLSILDNQGTRLPTLAPAADYFLGVALGSAGAVFDSWGSDPNRSPSTGNALSLPAPTVQAVPEPETAGLVGGLLVLLAAMGRRTRRE